MTRPLTATRSAKAIHAIIVALSVACSIELIGATRIDPKPTRSTVKPVTITEVKSAVATPVASVAKEEPEVELLRPLATIEKLPEPKSRAPKMRVVRMEVTAYCPCTKCCGPNAQGMTASGKPVHYNEGKFVAADTSLLPFGTELVVPGYANSQRVEVVDRGGAIKGHKLDLYFPTHKEALVWGRQKVDVTIYE